MKTYRRELSPLRGVVCHLCATSSLKAERKTKSVFTHTRVAVRLVRQTNCELLRDCVAIIQKEEGKGFREGGGLVMFLIHEILILS